MPRHNSSDRSGGRDRSYGRPRDRDRDRGHEDAHDRGPSQRQLRVGEVLRHALADILRRDEIRDPDLSGVSVTVTQVKPSPDMRHATVFVEPLGGQNADTIVKALNRHKGFLRGELGRTITLKFTPELRFIEDTSFAEAEKIEAILKSEKVARDLAAAAGTKPPARTSRRAMRRTMARKRKGTPIHGWVILDKPKGITSTLAVTKIRRLFDAQKAGHAGTLDPMATGVLAIALGEATKTVPFAMDGEKVYRFTVRWGEATDTPTTRKARSLKPRTCVPPPHRSRHYCRASPASSCRRRRNIPRSRSRANAPMIWRARAKRFCWNRGPFSSVKSALRPSPTPTTPPSKWPAARVPMSVPGLAISPGPLGTVAHVSELRRLRVGPFDEKAAISLDLLESLGHGPAALEHLRPLATALDDIPALAVHGSGCGTYQKRQCGDDPRTASSAASTRCGTRSETFRARRYSSTPRVASRLRSRNSRKVR